MTFTLVGQSKSRLRKLHVMLACCRQNSWWLIEGYSNDVCSCNEIYEIASTMCRTYFFPQGHVDLMHWCIFFAVHSEDLGGLFAYRLVGLHMIIWRA